MTIQFNGSGNKLSIKNQLDLITESIAMVFFPPSNCGLNDLVAGYNMGKYPYGLGDTAVHT